MRCSGNTPSSKNNLKGALRTRKKDYDIKSNPTTYEVGDFVYKINFVMQKGASRKQLPIYDGPFVVTRVLSPSLIEIEGKNKNKIIHHDELKICQDRYILLWIRHRRLELLSLDDTLPYDEVEHSLLGDACLNILFDDEEVVASATNQDNSSIISYLGMKSWDLHVCDRASTITHVDRVKKSNPWYNKIWLCLNVTIWSSQICFSVIFIHFVMIQNIWEKKLHLFTLFSITRHCFSLFLVGSKSMLALLPFKVTITPRHWNDKCFHRAGGDLICRFCICASHFQCIVGAQQEILCLTVHTTWLIWRVWPRSLGMSVPVWQRHHEVE